MKFHQRDSTEPGHISASTRPGSLGATARRRSRRMQPSRLVVLAAGVGSRLEPRVGAKPLVRVGGMTLLERSIVAAHEAGFEDVVVITGHDQERVAREALNVSRRRGLRVVVVHNARYREGNGLSVLTAKDVVGDAPFALVMADHVFAPAFLRRLRATSVMPGELYVGVDRAFGRATGVDPTVRASAGCTTSGRRLGARGRVPPSSLRGGIRPPGPARCRSRGSPRCWRTRPPG